MRRLLVGILLQLFVFSAVRADPGIAEIELIPDVPPPYLGGESLTVDVWVHSNDTVAHDLRLVQLDIRQDIAYKQILAAGGTFALAGGTYLSGYGVTALGIATFEDGAWSPLGAEGSGVYLDVNSIVQFDDGSGPALFVGGNIIEVRDCLLCQRISVNYVVKWDGNTWHAVGDGLNDTVRALAVHDDGTGPALYAAGDFFYTGSTVVQGIAKWDGTAWSSLGYFGDPAYALSVFDDGAGAALYVGGEFTHAYWDPMEGIAKWDSNQLMAVADDLILGVDTLSVFDDGTGAALYAGGIFAMSATQSLDRIAKLDGDFWVPLGSGISGASVRASTVFSTPAGDVLVVGGDFSQAGGVAANNIAQWDGVSWSPLGSGTDGSVNALIAYDDGTGQSLYVGGEFQLAGGESGPHIAKWDGTAWSDVAHGMSQTVDVFEVVDGDPLPDIALPTTFDFVSTTGYFVWSALPWPTLASTSTSPNPSMLHLDAQGSVHVGSVEVVLPTKLGSYTLDVVNAVQTHPDMGAVVSFGFGSAIDEPVTYWRANTGELSGGTYIFAVVPPPPTVEGVGARYLAVTPPAGPDPVAFLVTPFCPEGEAKYVGAATEISPHGFFAYLVDDPVYLTPAQWGGTVNVTGIQITPSTTYDVQTESTGGVVSAPGTGTTWLWGDVDNSGVANFNDVLYVIQAFGGNFTNTTFAGADLALPILMGCFSADRIINTNDTSAAIKAYQSNPYPCPECP